MFFGCSDTKSIDSGNILNNNRMEEDSILKREVKDQKIDTLFQSEYFYPFSIYNDQILLVEQKNSLYIYDIITKNRNRLLCEMPTDYETQWVLHDKDLLIVSSGGIEQIDTTFFINKNNCKLLSKMSHLYPKNYLPNGSFLCVDTKSDDFDFYFLVIDPINLDTLYRFKKNTSVFFLENSFLSIDNENKQFEFYDMNFKNIKNVDFLHVEPGEIKEATDSFYLIVKDKLIRKKNYRGDLMGEWSLVDSFYYKILIENNIITIYAWLNTEDVKRKKYYFVRQKIW